MLTGQKMRSSFTPTLSGKLDPDLWLHTKNQKVGSTVRFHEDYIEHLTWDLEVPKEQRVTSIILVRSSGQCFSAQSQYYTFATQQAKSLAGIP